MSIVAEQVTTDRELSSVLPFDDERVQSLELVARAVKQAAESEDGRAGVEIAEDRWYDGYDERVNELHPADRGQAGRDGSRYWAFVRYQRDVYGIYPLNPE